MDRGLIVGIAKDWGLALVIVVAVMTLWSVFSPGPRTGGDAPTFVAQDLQGNPVDLAKVTGDVVFLNFWATWCGPCQAEIPELNAFAAEHPDVTVIGVSTDERMSPDRLAIHARKLNIEYPVWLDDSGAGGRAYDIQAIPATFVLDKDRHVITVIRGGTDRHGFEEALAAVAD